MLEKLASPDHPPKGALVKELKQKYIDEEEVQLTLVQIYKCWIGPIFDYINQRTLPEEHNTSRRIKYISNIYLIREGVLYKRGCVLPFMTACTLTKYRN